MFAIMSDALARHISPDTALFEHIVFSLHDADELKGLVHGAGFRRVDVQAKPKTLRLPSPQDFLWQYVHSTPLIEAVMHAEDEKRIALERDVTAQWDKFVVDGGMTIEVGMTTTIAEK